MSDPYIGVRYHCALRIFDRAGDGACHNALRRREGRTSKEHERNIESGNSSTKMSHLNPPERGNREIMKGFIDGFASYVCNSHSKTLG